MSVLVKYGCGHVGRENDSPRAKVKEFIRVAEIRDDRVEEEPAKKCPGCQ